MELDRKTYSRADAAQTNQTVPAPQTEVAQAPATPRPQTEIAQNRATPQTAPADEGRSLPRTASPIPLASLAGLLALGASVAVRAMNRV
jgi:hypothetical protein